REIVDLQLERVRRRLAERHITLEVTPEALEFVGNEGYDPVYGARPLKRVIQRRLLDRLAVAMLDGTVRDGNTVVVDVRGADITISVRGAGEPAEAASMEAQTV
ncbi:MAG: type VI secretion system ATPase TssH, partial [Chloroflexota bacterium]|nr:type VI secretion system ATPase TssH [Chloroflexota bacterium]